MTWFWNALSRYPELAVFPVVGLGGWLGALKVYGRPHPPDDVGSDHRPPRRAG